MKKNYKKSVLILLLGIIAFSNAVNAQTIAAGGWHSLVVCTDGSVKAFGENATGELGNGSNTDSNLPVTPTGLTGIISVSGGGDQLEEHSLALKSDGTVWTWGWNVDGQLGIGSNIDKTFPVKVPGLTGVIKIAAGTYHVLALKNDGTVWAWGDNISGQIGDNSTTDRTSPVQVSGL